MHGSRTTAPLPIDAPAVSIRKAELADKPTLWRLLQLYLHDFSEFLHTDVGPSGEFEYPYFDAYWSELGRVPFLIEAHGSLAGFALVRGGVPNDLAEFFVLRNHRRHGVGRQAAAMVFADFPGEWQVRQLDANHDATAFWRSTLPYPFTETRNAEGPIQHFTVPCPAAR